MVNKLLRAMTTNREKILALVMLPVFLVGTLPQATCICADGHREASCPKLKGGSEKRVRSCCAAKSRAAENGIGSKTHSCCRMVIAAPPATAVVKESREADASPQMVSSDCVLSHVADLSFRPASSRDWHCQPPPRDAVILFSRLTI